MKLRGLAWAAPALLVIGMSGCNVADASHEVPPPDAHVQVETADEGQPAKIIIS